MNKCWCGRKHRNINHFAWEYSVPAIILCPNCHGSGKLIEYALCNHCNGTSIPPIPLSEFEQ